MQKLAQPIVWPSWIGPHLPRWAVSDVDFVERKKIDTTFYFFFFNPLGFSGNDGYQQSQGYRAADVLPLKGFMLFSITLGYKLAHKTADLVHSMAAGKKFLSKFSVFSLSDRGHFSEFCTLFVSSKCRIVHTTVVTDCLSSMIVVFLAADKTWKELGRRICWW